jgi:hypothetical protein
VGLCFSDGDYATGESDASLLDRIVKTAASLRPRGDFKHVPFAGLQTRTLGVPARATTGVAAGQAEAQGSGRQTRGMYAEAESQAL